MSVPQSAPEAMHRAGAQVTNRTRSGSGLLLYDELLGNQLQ